MKTLILRRLAIAVIAIVSFEFSIYTDADDQANYSATDLRKVDLFAFGYIGFAGHISDGQELYEEILKSENPEIIFVKIAQEPSSSVASKLYSLCGLKALSSKKYKSVKDELFVSYKSSKVSTMRADVMEKQEVGYVIKKIDRLGCKINN